MQWQVVLTFNTEKYYGHVSKQEFGHMLLAIQDLLQYIYEETRENPEERQELYNFIHMIKG